MEFGHLILKQKSINLLPPDVTQVAEFIGPLTADERQWRLCLGIGMPIAGRQRTASNACSTMT